jgi:hypothetical protein
MHFNSKKTSEGGRMPTLKFVFQYIITTMLILFFMAWIVTGSVLGETTMAIRITSCLFSLAVFIIKAFVDKNKREG